MKQKASSKVLALNLVYLSPIRESSPHAGPELLALRPRRQGGDCLTEGSARDSRGGGGDAVCVCIGEDWHLCVTVCVNIHESHRQSVVSMCNCRSLTRNMLDAVFWIGELHANPVDIGRNNNM
jgi:hypothetical protein